MNKFITIFFFCITLFFRLDAQILPKENSKLNYRLVGFSFPVMLQSGAVQKGAAAKNQTQKKYKIEVAAGNYFSDDSFRKNIVVSFLGDTNRIIGVVPSFNAKYTWRVVAGVNTKSKLHHFSTGIIAQADTNNVHLRILQVAEKYKDAYIIPDGTGVLYDMTGAPLWYLPDTQGPAGIDLRDAKLSPAGTITYIHLDEVYEVDYNGRILWKGPNTGAVSGDKIEGYHHEFTRLQNGHYMAMGREYAKLALPAGVQPMTGSGITKDSDNVMRQNLVFGTLIEYDAEGNVVWSWKSSKYAQQCDLYNEKTGNWRYDINDLHDNAFYFDEQAGAIYVSFKNISRVVKIKYPEGNVIGTYGSIYGPGEQNKTYPFFCDQHCCRRSKEGYLYLFNNNDCERGTLPKLVMMQEPVLPGDTLKKVWEYECEIDYAPDKGRGLYAFNGGGNVFELPGGELFANMCSRRYNKAFIISRDKKVLWSALFELWDSGIQRWRTVPNYRVSIITDRKDLERLIWNQEL